MLRGHECFVQHAVIQTFESPLFFVTDVENGLE
jgi:hypothetical protein